MVIIRSNNQCDYCTGEKCQGIRYGGCALFTGMRVSVILDIPTETSSDPVQSVLETVAETKYQINELKKVRAGLSPNGTYRIE
jgi:hypothetical protein